jgi:hypothetical protein
MNPPSTSMRSFVHFLRRVLPHVAHVLVYAAILGGTAYRLRETFLHNPIDQIFSDPQRHWTFGQETLHPDPWMIIDPPLFQMWLSLVQKLTTGIPYMTGAYAGLLSAVTPWLWYRFLREATQRRLLALVGWALLAWLPSWIGIYSYFMTETLFLTLMGASLWQTMRARRMRTLSSFLGMATLWLLTGLTRGIAIPMGGLAGLWVWLVHPHKVRTAVWSLVIVVCAAVPLAVRNHDFLGLWSPMGTGWPNQIYAESGKRSLQIELIRDSARWNYIFQSPSESTKPFEPLSNWESRRDGQVQFSIDLRRGNADWKDVYEKTALRGKARWMLRWENLVLVMFGQSWPDNNFSFPVHWTAYRMRWVWAPLLSLFVFATLLWRKAVLSRPLVPILIATWFYFQAISLLAINEGRYRKPLEGLLIVEIVILVDVALERSRARRTPKDAGVA